MKKSILLGCLMIFCLTTYAQETTPNPETLPKHSVSITSGIVYNGGFEISIDTEYFLNTNHVASIYGAANYLSSMEFKSKMAMVEIGGRCYIPAIRNKLYPYIGLGVTAGMRSDDNNSEPLLFGGVGTVGLEYLLTKNVGIEILGRIKYTSDNRQNYVIGCGLKYCF